MLADAHFICRGKPISIESLASTATKSADHGVQFRKLAIHVEQLDEEILALHKHLLDKLPVSHNDQSHPNQAQTDKDFLKLIGKKVGDKLTKLVVDLER